MGAIFRATADFLLAVRNDLQRPHDFARERVGFIAVRAAHGLADIVLLADRYFPVADDEYLQDPSVGAMMGSEAIRRAMEVALLSRVGIFHVHMHHRPGRTWFSSTDLREQLKFVPDFFNVRPEMPHGAIVLGPDSAAGRIWYAPDQVGTISEFNVVGSVVSIQSGPTDGVDFKK